MWKHLYPVVKWYFRRVFRYADVIIAISPMVENEIKKLGVNTKIIKIYNPIMSEKWKRTEQKRALGRKRMGLSQSDFVVLGVGQLQSRKGVEDFIEMARAIPELQFVWVGGRPFGRLTEGIKRINNKIKHAPVNIHFLGIMEFGDMPNIYSACDIFIFPSYQENSPLAPLEAAASGVPVVFRDISEYSLLYENAYLKARDNAEFIATIKKLKEDKDYYQQGIILSKNLISQFDKDKISQQLANLYTATLNAS